MYKIECEWDIGLNDKTVYKTYESAMKALKSFDWEEMGLLEEGETLEDLIEQGLVSIIELTVEK